MSPRTKERRKSRFIFYAALVIFAAFHLYQMTAPPNGYHRWRESDTAAVILNYYQEDMSFLEPRINQRGATSGITGMELPIYNFSAAVLYKLLGPGHALARLFTLLTGLISIWLFYRIVRITLGDSAAVMAGWAFAFSPLFFFYSYKIMPDILMLALFLGAVHYYLRFYDTGKYRYWIVSVLMLALSAGIKPLGLAIYLPFLFLLLSKRKTNIKAVFLLAGYIAITFLPVLCWLQYARWLQSVHGLGMFYLGGHGITNFHEYLLSMQFVKKLVLQWPFELWIGWVMVPPFVYGIYCAFRNKICGFYFFWIAAMYLVFAITAVKTSTHDYYTLVVVPPVAAITGVGLRDLYMAGRWKKVVAILLLIAAPVGSFIRIYPRFDDASNYYQIRKVAENRIPEKSLVMVEDKTPAVRLYQLNRKGWPLRKEISFSEVESRVKKGAEYLILDKPLDQYNDSLRLLFADSAIRLGPLYCYALK